jgi:hypothetical protein
MLVLAIFDYRGAAPGATDRAYRQSGSGSRVDGACVDEKEYSSMIRSVRRFLALGLCVAFVGVLAGCTGGPGGERVQQEGAGSSVGQGPTGSGPVKEDPAGKAAGGSGMPVPR